MAKKRPVPRRVREAAAIKAANPNLTMTQCLCASGKYSETECKNKTLQMAVRRYCQELEPFENPPSIIVASSSATRVSNLTTSPSVSRSDSPPRLKDPPEVLTTTATSAASSSSARKRRNHNLAPGAKEIRFTAKQAQQNRVNNKKIKDKKKEALKEATRMYAAERSNNPTENKGKGKGAVKIAEEVNKKYNTTLSGRTIMRYVANGMIGVSPLKMGPDGGVPEEHFKLLLLAVETYIRISQINGETSNNTATLLTKRINSTMNNISKSSHLFQRVMRECAIDFKAGVSNPIEERRLRWTTFHNLNTWHENWERCLVELGFGTKISKHDGKEIIEVDDAQKKRILNLDESALTLNGNSKQRGGRPSVTFFDGGLPSHGIVASKTSQSTTFITGSNSFGEVLPPHFQFSTNAKSSETEKIRADTVLYMKGVRGQFGFESEQIFACTFGLNEKGGMDKEEFEKYIFNSIIPLYPDMEDVPGKRVLIKIDSGPGRSNNQMMCARLRNRGAYLFPGVPNTTSVSQETDRGYGPFKTAFRKNLSTLSADRMVAGKKVSFPPWLVGLFVFGGCDPETGIDGYEDAFNFAFSREKCLRAWELVGAIPPTRACLNDPKVRRELGDSSPEDEMQIAMVEMQEVNTNSCNLLQHLGYDGSLLRVKLRKHATKVAVTVPHSKERLEALAAASTHGAFFAATGGEHFTADDVFKQAELVKRKEKIAQMERDKKLRESMIPLVEKAEAILREGRSIDNLRGNELTILLRWHQVPKAAEGKLEIKRKKWQEILDSGKTSKIYNKWSDAEETELQSLKSDTIDLADTALGRLKQENINQMKATIKNMTKEEKEAFLQELKGSDDEEGAV